MKQGDELLLKKGPQIRNENIALRTWGNNSSSYSLCTLAEGRFLLWDSNDEDKDCALSASFVIPHMVFVLILENQERKPGFLSVFLLLVRTNLKERRGRCAVTSKEIQLDSSLMQFVLCFQHQNLS